MSVSSFDIFSASSQSRQNRFFSPPNWLAYNEGSCTCALWRSCIATRRIWWSSTFTHCSGYARLVGTKKNSHLQTRNGLKIESSKVSFINSEAVYGAFFDVFLTPHPVTLGYFPPPPLQFPSGLVHELPAATVFRPKVAPHTFVALYFIFGFGSVTLFLSILRAFGLRYAPNFLWFPLAWRISRMSPDVSTHTHCLCAHIHAYAPDKCTCVHTRTRTHTDISHVMLTCTYIPYTHVWTHNLG